jgi:hypothetical protein
MTIDLLDRPASGKPSRFARMPDKHIVECG